MNDLVSSPIAGRIQQASREKVMSLRYLRTTLFWHFLRPFSERTRQKRMQLYTRLMPIREGTTVLDLGGKPKIWESVAPSLWLTILNLPGAVEDYANGQAGFSTNAASHHAIRYVEGDACGVDAYGDLSFDSVFSNSVIEHVGSIGKQAAFASEVRRLGKSYWVQTPAKWFPIEAHCGMPLWWFYPSGVRRWLIDRWRKKLPAWTEMVEGTTVLTKSQMRRYFPEATILTERSFGIPKSYIAYYPGESI
jgi:hypothetical protein